MRTHNTKGSGGVRRRLAFKWRLLLSYFLLVLSLMALLFVINTRRISGIVYDNVTYSAEQSMNQLQAYLEDKFSSLYMDVIDFSYNQGLTATLSQNPRDMPINKQMAEWSKLRTLMSTIMREQYHIVRGIKLYINDAFVFASEAGPIYPFSAASGSAWYERMQTLKRRTLICPPELIGEEGMFAIVHMLSDANDYSKLVAAIRIDISVENIRAILRNGATTKHSVCYLESFDGLLLGCSDDQSAACAAERRERARALTPENSPVKLGGDLAFTAMLSDDEFRLTQLVPVRDITVMSRSYLPIFVAYIALILVLFFLLSARIASGITGRLQALIHRMKAFSAVNGHPDEPPALPASLSLTERDDIDQLVSSYDQLIRTVEQLTVENIAKGKQLNEMELTLLHAQINPHFLFNTLDMIRYLADANRAKDISEATLELSQFYRIGLSKGRPLITLKEELDCVRAYVKIQNFRFNNALTLEIDVAEEFMSLSVPRITLQPIVENAVMHGILEKPGASGTVRVSCKWIGGDALISVRDDGVGIPPEKLLRLTENLDGNGYGLKNTHERIQLQFSKRYGISIHSKLGEYTQTDILIPRDWEVAGA